MAAPKNRRPGFSRKAQLKIFTGYLLAFTGAFAGLLLLALSYVDPLAFAFLRNGAMEVTAPISKGLASVRSGSQQGWREVSAYFYAASKNADLEREAEQNRIRLIEARALKEENRELRRLLGVIEQEGSAIATGRLINSTSSSTRRLATLALGSRQGVARGQPVRGQKGLIGRVLTVGPNTAQVLLLSDPENVVPVRRARDGIVAFSEGRGDGLVNIRLINVGINPFKVGDVMVTSGSGGLYSPNVPVAIIEKLTSEGAIARVLADPAATDFVFVQQVYKPEPAPAAPSETDGNPAQSADQPIAQPAAPTP